jgi:hypothetical protein
MHLNRIYPCVVALLLGVQGAQADDFPAGPVHDIVAKACTACHDAGMVTSQHKSQQEWSDTVHQMISNGAQVAPGDVNTVVAYLAKSFGAAAAPAAAPAAPGTAPARRSKNDVPVYVPLTWQRVEGKPIDTRWPEKQDDAPDFPGQTRAPYHASVPYKTTFRRINFGQCQGFAKLLILCRV